MKASLGQYIESLGKVANDQQYFIKKLLSTLQLVKPQSKEFSNQLSQLKQEFEEKTAKYNLEPNEEVAKLDSFTNQIQKDIESINVQIRVLKSASATSRKGQGTPDLIAIEKSKKLKQSLKDYQNESSAEISEIKTSLARNSSELKNSGETITNIQANLQATREELNIIKAKLQADEKESMISQIKDMQIEIEALKSLTEVIHKGIVSKEFLLQMKQSDTRTINILKNSMQSLKDEVKSIKLLKQGKIPTSFSDLTESLNQSINSLQDEMQNVKKDIDDKSSLLEKAQQEITNIRIDTDQIKSTLSNEPDHVSLADRMNLIEEKVNTLSSHSLQFDQMYNTQKDFMNNLKDELLPDLVNRVTQVESQVSEISLAESTNATNDEKNKSTDEYQNLNQKVEQMIHDIQTSNIAKRSIRNKNIKADVPRAVGALKTFQKALLAQEQADIFQHIDQSHLPLIIQSIDQLISEVYSEMYRIRDQLSKEIVVMKKYSIPLKVDDFEKPLDKC